MDRGFLARPLMPRLSCAMPPRADVDCGATIWASEISITGLGSVPARWSEGMEISSSRLLSCVLRALDLSEADYTAARAAFVQMKNNSWEKVDQVKKELGDKWQQVTGKKQS